jgi:hypothetical protein
MIVTKIDFPKYSGTRCLMMPFIQGDPHSLPDAYLAYADVIQAVFFKKGDIGYLTIDESVAKKDKPHRGARATTNRALHTEAGRIPEKFYGVWGGGGGGWGKKHLVTLDAGVEVMLANNLDNSCAIWDAIHQNTSVDGDIGYASVQYPYEDAIMMQAGDVHKIGIFTPHESLPVKQDTNRQFLRIVSAGVYGREPYFTPNPLL